MPVCPQIPDFTARLNQSSGAETRFYFCSQSVNSLFCLTEHHLTGVLPRKTAAISGSEWFTGPDEERWASLGGFQLEPGRTAGVRGTGGPWRGDRGGRRGEAADSCHDRQTKAAAGWVHPPSCGDSSTPTHPVRLRVLTIMKKKTVQLSQQIAKRRCHHRPGCTTHANDVWKVCSLHAARETRRGFKAIRGAAVFALQMAKHLARLEASPRDGAPAVWMRSCFGG